MGLANIDPGAVILDNHDGGLLEDPTHQIHYLYAL